MARIVFLDSLDFTIKKQIIMRTAEKREPATSRLAPMPYLRFTPGVFFKKS